VATYLVVGLGNPGPKYQGTRHNAGFLVLDRLADEAGIAVTRKQFNGLYGEGTLDGHRLFLLKPQTFMNLSGRSVAEAVRFHKLPLTQIIVVHDELDIRFGQVMVKEGGGHGGHNGLRSLIQELAGNKFVRVRFGIDRSPGSDTAGYVLTPFPREQQLRLPLLIDRTVELLRLLLNDGVARAMNQYNKKDLLASP
jgi:PTH1 family peptidyl-tRNA hydrolase